MFPDDPTSKGARRDVRPVRIPDAASQVRQAEHRIQEPAMGKVSYHAACHQRVQRIGPEDPRGIVTRARAPRSSVIERCSGHDGTYAVKRVARTVDEDRQAGGQQGQTERACPSLQQ